MAWSPWSLENIGSNYFPFSDAPEHTNFKGLLFNDCLCSINLLLNTDLSFLFLLIFLILKVLLGLQLLAGKAQTLQENDSKFFLKGKAKPWQTFVHIFWCQFLYFSSYCSFLQKWIMYCIFKTFLISHLQSVKLP